MKEIIISPEILAAAPGYHMIYIEADVVNGPGSPALYAELDELCAEFAKQYSLPDINKRPGIAATRAAYKKLGKDPNRYRPSQEQMMRRIVKGQGLYRVDALVDAGNLLSLSIGSSLGMFDRDKIQGNRLTLGVGREGEPYEGIGRGVLNICGLPVIRDAAGGIGTPTSDAERTKVDADTRRLSMCINVYDPAPLTLQEIAARAHSLLTTHCSATSILTNIYP